MRHFVFFFFAFILGALLLTFSSHAAHANPKYASIIMDAGSGTILHQRYANKKLHPASLTKVMTLMMLFDALERGDVKLRDTIRISRNAANAVPSKLGLKVGSRIRVEDAILALTTKSANDIAIAVAEHLAGSQKKFAKRMTARAHALGMRSTIFKNASGLHDRRQVSTAQDMAKMARALVYNYPEYYHYFSVKSFTYKGKTYRNHNRLLGKYKGVDGLKTGYVNASGFNLIATAKRNDRRIIAVVFGGKSSKTRNSHMVSLLDKGFKKVKSLKLRIAKAPLPAHKPGTAAPVMISSADAPLPHNAFEALMGEGDIDHDAQTRLETGLLAIAAHKGEPASKRLAMLTPTGLKTTRSYKTATANPRTAFRAPYKAPPTRIKDTQTGDWAIQVGAYNSRATTDKAIHYALRKLPKALSQKSPIIAPLQTGNGWIYRGRIQGFTAGDARKACSYLTECMPIAPAVLAQR